MNEIKQFKGLYSRIKQMFKMSTMRLFKLMISSFALFFSISSFAVAPVYTERGSDIAIKGYDPVAYFTENKPVKGSEEYSFEHNGAVWLFSSEENRVLFISDPKKYSPQYGGYCAYAVSRNMTASIQPELFTIEKGKLYLNYNNSVNNRFLKNMDKYIAKADENWPKILKR